MLEDLLALLRAEPAGDPALAEVQQVADGFLRLTMAELVAANRVVYSALDVNVTPPVELERKLPAWNPPPEHELALVSWRRGGRRRRAWQRRERHGWPRRWPTSTMPASSRGSLAGASQPALRAGQPVKYRKLVEITMRPQ